MKVIFLDIDGVLVVPPNPLHTATCCNNPVKGMSHIPSLNFILGMTGAKIVISSNWRLAHSVRDIDGMLTSSGMFFNKVIGATAIPDRKSSAGILIGKTRGQEIQEWLDAHSDVENFVILDDDDDIGDLKHALVQTDPMHGLSVGDAERAIEILMEVKA